MTHRCVNVSFLFSTFMFSSFFIFRRLGGLGVVLLSSFWWCCLTLPPLSCVSFSPLLLWAVTFQLFFLVGWLSSSVVLLSRPFFGGGALTTSLVLGGAAGPPPPSVRCCLPSWVLSSSSSFGWCCFAPYFWEWVLLGGAASPCLPS